MGILKTVLLAIGGIILFAIVAIVILFFIMVVDISNSPIMVEEIEHWDY